MTDFLEATVRGLSQGSLYALLGLGFVLVYKGTGVISLAQPMLMILGAYFASAFAVDAGIPFVLAVALAIAASALVAGVIERVAMRPMVGEPVFAAVMVTVGLFLVLDVITAELIGSAPRGVGDPWGLEKVDVGGVSIFESDIARIGIAVAAVGAFGAFYRYTRWGLALRATSFSQETALAQGVPVGRMFALSWVLAGALAGLSGTLVGAAPGGFTGGTALVALKALPAIILGGLDSTRGAIAGGLAIGLVEGYTKEYQPDHLSWLGANFDQVVPYVVMLLVLLIRPYGLFGTPEVRRV